MNRNIRLVIFDLDGTLTPVESLWRYLHEAFGTWEQGKIAALKYSRGEISYKQWAESDAGYWAGVSLSRVTRMLEEIPYRRGAREVFAELKRRQVKTAIVSAGLSLLTNKVAEELEADAAVSNELETREGWLTGGIRVRVAVNNKREIIEQVAASLQIALQEVALVGDQAFDLSHSECLRIAFKPKNDIARRQADFVVEDDDLTQILQYLI
ncbi:MAG: HAD-IB family phosphatase [Candidatus Bathyarchaeia archaeon]|jgi:phosphoserine phosphatase